MRTLLLALQLCWSLGLHAQSARNLFAFTSALVDPLDKSAVPSGSLWDKGGNGLTELRLYDGVAREGVYLRLQTSIILIIK